MSATQRGPIRRVLGGLWATLNFTRQLVFNVIFLLLAVIVLAAIFASPGAQPLVEDTALVLDLDGALVEQFTASPVDRQFNRLTGQDQPEIQLRDLLRAIDAAKDDARIDRIVLLTDGFSAPGFAAMRDFAAALRDFRAAGKEVVAYGSGMDQKQYYIAAQADEVYLDPQGLVLIEGLGRYRMYYREGLQDKLGVDVHLFKVGEYKSAAEPYVLDAASPEAREADLFWMTDIWNRFVADIAAARKLDPAALGEMIVQFPQRVQAHGGDTAKLALDEKLVDGLKMPHELEQMLVERGAAGDDDVSFRQIGLDGYLAHLGRATTTATCGRGSRPRFARPRCARYPSSPI